MEISLTVHKNLLQNKNGSLDENLVEFLNRFKEITTGPMYSNSLCYALDLHEMKYAYVSSNCGVFTGKSVASFLKHGIDLLPTIMIPEDFKRLSVDVFPQMQAAYSELKPEYRTDAIFEIYYRLKHVKSGKITPVVEYSSYARFDDRGVPSISTGIVYESPLSINGVRGIVRSTGEDGQQTVYDQTYLHHLQGLTTAERRISELFAEGNSRQEIADELHISIHTVKTHFKNIYKKLKINKESDFMNYLNSN